MADQLFRPTNPNYGPTAQIFTSPAEAAPGPETGIPGAVPGYQSSPLLAQLTPQQRRFIEFQKKQQELEKQRGQQGLDTQKQQLEFEGLQHRQRLEGLQEEQRVQQEMEQRQRDVAEALKKKEMQRPFQEQHPYLSAALPWGTMAASAVHPALKNYLNSMMLRRFMGKWGQAGEEAATALGAAKTKASAAPATLATERLKEFEARAPEMEQRYTPQGLSYAQAIPYGLATTEAGMFPTEWDYKFQGSDSPTKPGLQEWLNALAPSAAMGVGAIGLSALGSKFGRPPAPLPFIGGPGIIRSYEQKFPPKKTK
jgi:hypothetical protein